MTISTAIADAFTRISAGITDDREICTINAPYPPLSTQKVRPFRQYLTDDGLPTGTIDMSVDGSSTNIDYYVPAANKDDRYITSLSFIVGYGSSGSPYQWADGAELTNGLRLFYTSKQGDMDIHESIKNNQDMFRLSFSNITTAWEVRHVNANNDFGYFINTDFRAMGFPYGIKLDRGTTETLKIRIRDNVGSAADSFNCIAYGFDRYK